MRLVEPSLEMRESYLSLVREFTERGEALVPFTLELDTEDFPGFLQRLKGFARGIGIPEGFVPHSTYWLVDDKNEVVAVSNLRHRLTERLRQDGGHIGYGVRPSSRRRGYGRIVLAKTLEVARARGLERVMLTTRKWNVGSINVIRRNGGVLERERHVPEKNETILLFWIELG